MVARFIVWGLNTETLPYSSGLLYHGLPQPATISTNTGCSLPDWSSWNSFRINDVNWNVLLTLPLPSTRNSEGWGAEYTTTTHKIFLIFSKISLDKPLKLYIKKNSWPYSSNKVVGPTDIDNNKYYVSKLDFIKPDLCFYPIS